MRTPRAGPAGGREALARVSPEAETTLAAIESAMWREMAAVGRSDLAELTVRVVAGQHGLPPLARPAASGPRGESDGALGDWRRVDGLDATTRAALRFAAQVAFDVASLQADERGEALGALGAHAGPFVQTVWAADLLPRARAALDALFGPSAWEAPDDAPERSSAEAMNDLLRLVPGLGHLDPVTTELVRLLGARHHRCRLCASLRSRPALVAGADEATFAKVDRFAESDLPEDAKAALAFARAMIASPARLEPAVAGPLRDAFAPEACVELVLEVTRNATNKLAVALGADAPHVEEGVEVYEVTPDGEIRYGLAPP